MTNSVGWSLEVCYGDTSSSEDVIEMLHENIRKLINELKWSNLTEPQLRAIPLIVKGYNVLIIAPTGLGKTEAALLPIFNELIKVKPTPISVLYITPLKALINDLYRRISWWSSRLGFIVSRKHSEVPRHEKSIRLKKIPDILITTPEGLEIDLDWASKFRQYYKNIKWVIVDEVHELVNSKRGIQLSVLLERLRAYIGQDFQIIGLSATIGSPQHAAKLIFGSSKRPSCIVESTTDKKASIVIDTPANISNEYWKSIAEKVEEYLIPSTLIFVNSRFAAERVHEVLESRNHRNIYVHHSSVSREIKSSVEELLKNGKVKGVICTKTLELGIDIANVNLVVQIEPPGSVTTLVQRIGRSGHTITSKAQGVLICDDYVDVLECLATSKLALRGILEEPKILKKPLDVLAREILGMCLEKGEVNLQEAFNIMKKSYPYKTLTREEFNKLIEYLAKNNMITLISNNRVKLGPAFFRIWRFDENNNPWSKNFSEFFSLINEKQSFTVKYSQNTIGEVDAYFVYKHLRVGDVFRLSGKNWLVKLIDENSMKLEVIPSEEREVEIPLWRGGVQPRDYIIAKEMLNILIAFLQGDMPIEEGSMIVTMDSLTKLHHLIQDVRKKYKNIRSNTMYVERRGDETFFITFMGERVSSTLAHILMYKISSEYTLNVQARISPIGFSIKARNVDPLTILKNVDLRELPELIINAAKRSPLLNLYIKSIQYSFGKTGKVDEMNDSIIIIEACKQLIQEYFDISLTTKYIEEVVKKEKIIEVKSEEPSMLAKYIAKFPPIKPWVRDLSLTIINALEGSAFTSEELSIMLNLPEKTIENKLKELRKTKGNCKVFQFIDVDSGEWRWALEKDLEYIVNGELYRTSFIPIDKDERFSIVLKLFEEDHGHVLYLTAHEVMNKADKIMNLIDDVAYEVKVEPIINYAPKLYVKYYYVSKRILPYTILNAMTFLQKVKSNL